MLQSVNDLDTYTLLAADGEIGELRGFYFNELTWETPYLIADTGIWLPGRTIVIATEALGSFDPKEKRIQVNLTRDKIKNSPEVDDTKPLTRELEKQVTLYYGWKDSGALVPQQANSTQLFRSTSELISRYIHAQDGDLGHVEDLLVDDEAWKIRYVVVDTRNWWPGKKVLIAPDFVRRVTWEADKVFIDLKREIVKSSPEYKPEALLDRNYEERLYGYYGQQGYWAHKSDCICQKECRDPAPTF